MAEKRGRKRIVLFSDTHCGDKIGLTPPDWWYAWPDYSEQQKKICQLQRELWKFFSSEIDALKPIYAAICVGDMVSGKGERSGGTELRTSDREEQAEIAAFCINYCKTEKVVIVAGTPYHAGTDEDWEALIIPQLKAQEKRFEGHAFPKINDLQFDIKHFISTTSIPHGGFTPLARDEVWNKIWHCEHNLQPMADIIIRAHVHKYRYCGENNWLAINLPMMRGYGDKFGIRKCSGQVDIGMVVFDIDEDGDYKWRPIIAKLAHQKVHAYEL